MKKLLFKISSVIVTLALSLGIFASCGLFEVDSERDMAQNVATVRISESVDETNIYKKDLISGYFSYGYNYVQSYGYTTSKAYQVVLDNLVNSAVIIQQSRLELSKNSASDEAYKSALVKVADRKTAIDNLYNDGYLYLFASEKEVEDFENSNKTLKKYTKEYTDALNGFVYNLYKDKTDYNANYDAFAFISEKDAYSAVSSAIDSVNSLIKSFVSSDDEDEEEYEKITYTARTTPTMEEEEEDDAELLKEYKANKIDLSGDRATAFNKAKARLVKLQLLNENESVDSRETKYVLAYSYFNDMVKSSADSYIVSVYEQALKNESDIDYTKATTDDQKAKVLDNLWAQYQALQSKQSAEYSGNLSSYETQLSAVNDTTFLAYNQNGYFYVSHLLIGYTDEQKEKITEESEKADATEATVQAKANSLADEMVIEDQRASWVLSGYGTYDGNNFTFSDKYVYDTEGDLAKFQGTIGGVNTYKTKDDDGNDVNNFAFSNVKANKLSYTEFKKLASKAITGAESEIALDTVYGGIVGNKIDKTVFNKFEDLKFAFSTDTGNFNNYLGYAYSPITSKTQYVSAFYKACEEIGKQDNKVGAYIMFMSKEYGLHIVLCTATANFGVYADKDAFKADLADENSVAYLFMKAQVDLVTNNYISDIAQSFITEYTKEGAKIKDTDKLIVNYNEKAYNDLITEEE